MKIDEKFKEIAIIAMNKLMWFVPNMPFKHVSYELPWDGQSHKEWLPSFIDEVNWDCSKYHIAQKWKEYNSTHSDLSDVFSLFYISLDVKNTRALLTYIIDKYDNERSIRIFS